MEIVHQRPKISGIFSLTALQDFALCRSEIKGCSLSPFINEEDKKAERPSVCRVLGSDLAKWTLFYFWKFSVGLTGFYVYH